VRLRPAAAALALVAVCGGVAPASAADDLSARKRAADAAAQSLRNDLADTSADLARAVVALDQANASLAAARRAEVVAEAALDAARRAEAQMRARLEVAEQDQATAEAAVRATQAKLAQGQRIVDAFVRAAYQQGHSNGTLDVLLSSDSPSDFADRVALVRGALRSQGAAVRDMQVLQADLRTNEAAVAERRRIIAALEAQALQTVQAREQAEATASTTRVQAQSAVAAAATAQRAVAAKKAQEQQRLSAQEAESRHLEALLQARAARLLAAARAKAAREAAARRAAAARASAGSGRSSGSSGSGGSAHVTPPHISSGGSGAGLATSGYFSKPVAGPITSPYGMRLHPVLHVWKLHDGTDFGAACGTPIHASAAGTVVWAQYLTGYGNQLAIDHGVVNGKALTTSYSHQERFAVSVGQHVSRGQVIGYTGQTGYATGCHVHFMVYVNGATVNPISWL